MEGTSATDAEPREASQLETAAWIGAVVGAYALLVVSLAGYIQLVGATSDLGLVTHASWWIGWLASLGFVTLGAAVQRQSRFKRAALVFFGLTLHLLFDISLASWLQLFG